MITGASSGISAQFLNPAQSAATKADGLIFDSFLSGMIKGKEPATPTQDEPTVSPEMKDSEESADQEATEQGYLNLFPYRILQDGKATISVSNVPTDEKADQTGAWFVSAAEKQQVIIAKLDYSAHTVQTPTRPEEIVAKSHMESFLLSEVAIVTSASGSQAGEQAAIPESLGIREYGEKESYLTKVDMRRQQADYSLAEPEIPPDESLTGFPECPPTVNADPEGVNSEQFTELKITESTNRQSIHDEEENSDQPETVVKPSDSNENKALLTQGPITRELTTENVFGQKLSKVTTAHIEDIQKTIEMQIEKMPVLGNSVVKILLTPDNIGDIHVRLIKTKDSITAVLHVQDAETKGLLEDQLPLLMEPFKYSIPDSPLSLTVVADASLAFSFSEGADPGQRKMERQESRKRTSKEKTETKQKPTTNQSSGGLSLLA